MNPSDNQKPQIKDEKKQPGNYMGIGRIGLIKDNDDI